MGEQRAAGGHPRVECGLAHDDVIADGERVRIQRPGRLGGTFADMEPNVREVAPKRSLEWGAYVLRQRLARCVDDRRFCNRVSGSVSCAGTPGQLTLVH
jgi:hypothetical protein